MLLGKLDLRELEFKFQCKENNVTGNLIYNITQQSKFEDLETRLL